MRLPAFVSRLLKPFGTFHTGLGFAAVLLGLTALRFPARADGTNSSQATVVVVVGAPGEEQFSKVFSEAALAWRTAISKAGANLIEIGLTNGTATNDLEQLRLALTSAAANTNDELWVSLIGHGTFDGRETKFNLRGPDLSAAQLSNYLSGIRRPVAVINGASASAPFIKSLSGQGRVVITATRSGSEENFTRFGRALAQAITDPEADLDKDAQTSLLEAALMASRRVAEFYKNEGRLATEHALIDDNGDGLGTPAEWFRGVRAFKKAANNAPLDGMRAHQWHLLRSHEDQKLTPQQLRRRNELELEIYQLRERKMTLREDDYYRQLEELLTQLAAIELYGETSAGNASPR